MPGDYNGDGTYDVGTFRRGNGLWAVRDITRLYFGSLNDVSISPANFIASGGSLLKTGQPLSVRTGDDGYYRRGTAFSYQTSNPAGNGEIVTTDNVTGLMWASDGAASGCYNGGTRTWNEAIDWAEGLTFAGYSDWRLPNIRELHSLVSFGTDDPAINPTYFPNIKSSYYWSGSTFVGNITVAWNVSFVSSVVGYGYKTGTLYVRAVRGGK